MLKAKRKIFFVCLFVCLVHSFKNKLLMKPDTVSMIVVSHEVNNFMLRIKEGQAISLKALISSRVQVNNPNTHRIP